jgi:hypothetical protein
LKRKHRSKQTLGVQPLPGATFMPLPRLSFVPRDLMERSNQRHRDENRE